MGKKKSHNKNRSKNRNYDKEKSELEIDVSDQQFSNDDYLKNFAKSYLSDVGYIDPYIQNMILKDKNMNPNKVEAEQLINMMQNPSKFEKELREYAQYLDNVVMQMKRTIGLFASILSFDYYIEPTNADEDDMKTPLFKKSFKRANMWLDRFEIKKQFPDVMKKILKEGVGFYYVRNFTDYIHLQEMPINYCKIINKTEYGYQYAFDLSYFFQMGTNIDDYDPIFKESLDEYKMSNSYKSMIPYWVELNPINAPCFKFDETIAGIVPPFMAMFPESLDIKEYRNLTKAKGELDLFKIILNRIPIHGGDGKTRKANDLVMDGNMAGAFSKVMEEKTPNKKYVKVMTTPFESEITDFQRSENGNSEADTGNKLFYNSSGLNSNVLGGDATTASAIKASIVSATSFVSHMYPIFERFVNVHLKSYTGKYRWKIHFEGTNYDRDDRLERAFKAAGSGFPKTLVATALGISFNTLNNLTNFENSMDLTMKLIPFQSAHTMSNEGGKPKSSDGKLGDAGAATRNNDSNVR